MGLAQIDLLPGGVAAGRHLLTMGAMGLAIFIVLSIAGRAHVGRAADTGPWLAIGAALLLAGVAWRAAAALLGWPLAAISIAGAFWCAAYALLAWRVAPGLWLPRTDGQEGCAG